MSDDLGKILAYIEKIQIQLTQLQQSVVAITGKIDNISVHSGCAIKSIKSEKISLNKDFVKDNMCINHIDGDMAIIKKIYFDVDKSLYPIRQKNKTYEYYLDGNWFEDNSSYIKDIITANLRLIYLTHNTISDEPDSCDQFLKNQSYIMKMNDDNYKNRLLNEIRIFIR